MQKLKVHHILAISAVISLMAMGACSKLCNSGYEGSRCNELTTTKFLGTWSAIDTPGNLAYTDTISQGGVLGDITLSTSFNSHHFNHIINASVQTDVVTIPYQQPDSGKDFVSGTGTISAGHNSISFSYQIVNAKDSPAITTNYTGTWKR